jgi:proteasome lid subunit RPN8/RPN11
MTNKDFSIMINQLKIIEAFVQTVKYLDKVARRKAIMKFTYEKRTNDKTFVYFSVLNSGNAGETLSASPIAKQKEMKELFEDDNEMRMIVCFIELNDEKTVIDFHCHTGHKKDNDFNFVQIYKNEIMAV